MPPCGQPATETQVPGVKGSPALQRCSSRRLLPTFAWVWAAGWPACHACMRGRGPQPHVRGPGVPYIPLQRCVPIPAVAMLQQIPSPPLCQPPSTQSQCSPPSGPSPGAALDLPATDRTNSARIGPSRAALPTTGPLPRPRAAAGGSSPAPGELEWEVHGRCKMGRAAWGGARLTEKAPTWARILPFP